MTMTGNMTISKSLFKSLPYDVLRDFSPSRSWPGWTF